MLAYLREAPGPAAETSDVILASYAVHHLPVREKQLGGPLAGLVHVGRRAPHDQRLERAQRDFPETGEAISAMAHDAGFQESRELFRDATCFHRLMAFTRSRSLTSVIFVKPGLLERRKTR